MKWVLMVESSEYDKNYLERIVGRLGYGFYSTQSGEEAIHYMNQSLPNAVIIGEGIKDFEPLDLGRAIKEDRLLSSPPMLLLSSNKSPLFSGKARQVGFSEIVDRPMSIRKFFISLERCLSDSRRIYIRAPMSFPVLLRLAFEKVSLRTHNFGEMGMYIPSDKPPPSESEVEANFTLPGIRNEFSLLSRVMHTRDRDTDELPAGMGLKFLDVNPATEAIFGIYMENFLVGRAAA